MTKRARDEQRLAAFIGWQVRSAVSMGGKPPSYRAYLRQLGIPAEDAPTRAQLAAEKVDRDARLANVRAAFAQRGVRKAATG